MLIAQLTEILGSEYVLSGGDMDRWAHDWTGAYAATPLVVVRPADAEQVSAVLKLANQTGTPVIPVAGNTGLAGGTSTKGIKDQHAILLSVERMNRIRDIRPEARVAIVEAGVVLENLHSAADACDMIFPLTFGAKGSAMIGGCLATNAGGSNVVRYGNTRDLCLGLEVVLPNGEIMNLMSELHKDNSGFNLRHLMIGSEGCLGIITAAVLKLSPKPRAYATAMVAAPSLQAALSLLNRLQSETGGAVEAFEYMPGFYVDQHIAQFPDARAPFDERYDVNILVEIGATAPRDCDMNEQGQIPLGAHLEQILGTMFEEGALLDAVVAQNEAQRQEMWARREAAAEVSLSRKPIVNNDIAVPLDQVATFLENADRRLAEIDPGAQSISVAHLGDGNVHYTVWPDPKDAQTCDRIMEMVEDEALQLGGSFSAEHGIGLSKKPSMQRRKNPAALSAMRLIKQALDPNNILNPGKVLPDAT